MLSQQRNQHGNCPQTINNAGNGASSSVRNASGPRKKRGHISVRNTATPIESGTAIKSERNERTSDSIDKRKALK